MLPTLVTIGASRIYLPSHATLSSRVGITLGALALTGLATAWGLDTELITHWTTSWKPFLTGFVVFIAAWWFLVQWTRPALHVPLWTLWVLAGILLALVFEQRGWVGQRRPTLRR